MADSHLLQLDSLVISNADDWVAYDGYKIRTLATDADFGDPEPVTSEVAGDLMYGSLERITDWENRDLAFQIQVTATTANGLSQGQLAVELACRSARELRWTPPAFDGAVTVHDVMHAHVVSIFNDLDESGFVGAPVRTISIRLRAMPFPRSAELTVVPAIGSGTGTSSAAPVVTGLNPGTSTTGWSAYAVVNLGVAVTALGVGNATMKPTSGFLKWAGSWSMGTDRWLRVKYDASFTTGLLISVTGAPGLATLWPTAVLDRYAYYYLPAGYTTITQVLFHLPASGYVFIGEVARQNLMPFVSNTRQLIRQFEVKGSAEAEGNISLSHATLALGQVMVYTWPDDGSGYVPPISQYITSSVADAVTDTAAVMGRYLPITSTGSTSRSYEVPASTLSPGTYSVVLRAKAAAAGGLLINATAATKLGTAELNAATEGAYLQWATTYRSQSICQLTLPPAAVPHGSAAKVKITISLATASATLHLDEVYLCNVDTGELSLLDCGTGTPAAGAASSRAWIDSSTLDRNHAAYWVGTLADRSDARHIHGLDAIPQKRHRFLPGLMNMLTTSNAPDVAVEGSYYARHAQNAVL